MRLAESGGAEPIGKAILIKINTLVELGIQPSSRQVTAVRTRVSSTEAYSSVVFSQATSSSRFPRNPKFYSVGQAQYSMAAETQALR